MSDFWFGFCVAVAIAFFVGLVVVKGTEYAAWREGRTSMFTSVCAGRCGDRGKTVVDTANADWMKWSCTCAAESAVPLK